MKITAFISAVLLCAFSMLALEMSVPEKVTAIPAFARKYRTSCTTCHSAIPKRNAFGEAFRRNGYVMPEGDDFLTKQEPVPLGADEWKDLFPDAIWPGVLPAEFPLSAYVHQRAVVEFGDSKKDNQFEFDMPHELEIFMGGTFGESLSFFGEWVMFEKGKNAPGLKRFFFQFNDVLGPKNAFNIRIGRLEPNITDGLVDNNRVMLEHATTLDYKANGVWRPRNQQSGIELNGILNHRFSYGVGLVNGQTVGTGKESTIADNNNRKDFYGRVAYKIGGLAFDGYQDKELTSLAIADNWSDNSLTFGVYGYKGNYLVPHADEPELNNDFRRFGVDLHVNYNRYDFFAGAIFGTDDNPDGLVAANADERERSSTALFAEGYYTIKPWAIAGLRVGSASSEQNGDDIHKYVTYSPNMTLLLRANVRFSIEALIKSQGERRIGGVKVPGDQDGSSLKWLKFNTMFVF